MKKIRAFLLTMASVICIGNPLTGMAAEISCTPEQAENLTGTVWQENDVMKAEDCAIMLSYRYENEDGTQAGMDQLYADVDAYAQSVGYKILAEAGENGLGYSIFNADLQSATVIVLGQGWEYGVNAEAEYGMKRRFSHTNTIWMTQADGWQVASVEQQDWYEGADGEEYPCYYIELAPYHQKTTGTASTESASAAGCSHVFEYVIVREPQEKEDGLMAKQCEKCGAVAEYQPISALSAFLKNTAKAVKNAAAGAVVTVETDRWLCFDRNVMEAIASRPDVTVAVNYHYQHRNYTVTIPAGYDVIGLLNEEGFCGFRYLDLMLGGTEVVE